MKRGGFTLLETLAALAVLGLVLVGLAQGARFGLQGWRMQARQLAEPSGLDAVDRVLRRLVGAMSPGDTRNPPHVVGGAHELGFVSEFPAQQGPQGGMPVDVRLRLDGAHRLLLEWAPHRDVIWTGAPPAATASVLAEGVAGLDLSYWGGAGWRSDWTEPALPLLVRARVVFAPGDGRHWPDIIVAPRRQRSDG